MVAAADGSPTPESRQQCSRRTVILGAGGVLLLLAASLVGALLSRTPEARPPKQAPAYDSVTIVDALMVANQMQTPQTGAEVSTTSSNSPGPAPATPPPSAQAPPLGDGSGSPFAAIQSLFVAGANWTGLSIAQQRVSQPGPDGIPAGSVVTQAWKQLAGAGPAGGAAGRSVICYPTTGRELENMVGPQSPCNVLVLRNVPDDEYVIRRTLNVSTAKVLIGSPVAMPVLNCSRGLERLWDIQAGGRLDARFVTMVRGFGRRTGLDDEIRLTIGSHAIVRVGGYFTASACMFRERPNTAEGWLQEIEDTIRNPRTRNRNIGQLFLVLGGNIRFTGCRFFRMRPYGTGVFDNMTIGRDILVVAGNGVYIGCLTYGFNLYASNPWISGNAIAVLGGTALMVGGAMYGATGAQFQIGWGCQLFTAAGMLITIGWGYVSTNIVLGRVNGGQFSVGAGGVIQVGFYQGRAWGVGAVFGPGQSYAAATGLYYKVLSAFASFALSTIFCGLGGSLYIGAGSMKYIQVARTSNSITAATYGAGSTIFNGGGGLSLIYFEQFSTNVARWMAGAGSDWFLGGGWSTSVNHTRYGYTLVNAFTGAGGQAFVGLGAAVFIRTYSYSQRLSNWNTNPNTYTVAGMGTRKTRGQNIFISKKGFTEFIFNKTDGTVTKFTTEKRQKTRAPTHVPGTSKWGKRRRLPMADRKPRRRYVVADPADMRRLSWLADAVAATNAYPFEIPNKVVVLQDTLMEVEGPPPRPELLNAALSPTGLGGLLKAMADVSPDATDAAPRREAVVSPGKVSANNSACFLCQVGPGETAEHVGGPGACEVNDSCDGESPLDVQAEAQRHTEQDLSMPQTAFMPYKDEEGRLHNADVSLLWHELTVYCRPADPAMDAAANVTEGCLDPAYLKAVAMEFMGAEVSKLVEVAVSRIGVHSAAAGAVAEVDEAQALADALAPEWDPECQGWSKFNLYITTTFPDAAAAASEIWAGIVADPSYFSDAVVDNAAAADAGAAEDAWQPCRVAVARKASVTYPTIDKMPAYRPSREMALAPAVTVGSATAIVPVESLVAGRAYTIFVQNFPHNSHVTLVLQDAEQGAGAGAGGSPEQSAEVGVAVAAIDAFNDEDGVEEVAWTAPHAPGRYYLLAYLTNAHALFATSPVFNIVDAARGASDDHEEHAGQRRRLSRF